MQLQRETKQSIHRDLRRAGDICAILHASDDSLWKCALLRRHARNRQNEFPVVLLWLRETEAFEQAYDGNLFAAAVQIVCRSHLLQPSSLATQKADMNNAFHCEPPFSMLNSIRQDRLYGALQGGAEIIKRPILLRSDGFQHYQAKEGSAGGIYLSPLSVPLFRRKFRSAVLPVSLTPPGMSTKEILKIVVGDILRSSTEGQMASLPDGKKLRALVEAVGYVADYVEISLISDLKGHTAICSRHLCSFKRVDAQAVSTSRYGCSADINSESPAFSRSGMRAMAIRSASFSATDLENVGMEGDEQFSINENPFLRLQAGLMAASKLQKIPRTAEGALVVYGFFDAYRFILVGPDHLLSGIGKNILALCFRILRVSRLQRSAEILVLDALKKNNLSAS